MPAVRLSRPYIFPPERLTAASPHSYHAHTWALRPSLQVTAAGVMPTSPVGRRIAAYTGTHGHSRVAKSQLVVCPNENLRVTRAKNHSCVRVATHSFQGLKITNGRYSIAAHLHGEFVEQRDELTDFG